MCDVIVYEPDNISFKNIAVFFKPVSFVSHHCLRPDYFYFLQGLANCFLETLIILKVFIL